MAFINVNRDNTDQFYRYKMPRLIAKVEGKGNGIKTVIVNMVEIAKALGRPPTYTCKFFGCELGAQTQMDPKIGRFIVNGAHEGMKLQDMLDGFIKKFVLCPECENPETELLVQPGKGRIGQTCIACGYHGLLDMRHKLTTFILKNPPTQTEDSAGKKGKKERRRGKKEKGGDTPSSPSVDIHGEEEFDIPAPTNGKKEGKRKGEEEEDWSVDTSKEAVKARMENLSDQAAALALSSDLEKKASERVDIFYKFVEGIKKDGGVAAVSAGLSRIKSEAERLEVMDKAAGILAELLYTDQLLTQIKEYRSIMLHFVLDNRKAQKVLLGAFEILVGEVHPASLMVRVPHILKAFYDNDIIEEEVILEWSDKVSKRHVKKEVSKQIHEKAAPFVTWLRTAEEESSEEEEEDDVEVVYSDKVTGNSILQAEPVISVAADIDIEAI